MIKFKKNYFLDINQQDLGATGMDMKFLVQINIFSILVCLSCLLIAISAKYIFDLPIYAIIALLVAFLYFIVPLLYLFKLYKVAHIYYSTILSLWYIVLVVCMGGYFGQTIIAGAFLAVTYVLHDGNKRLRNNLLLYNFLLFIAAQLYTSFYGPYFDIESYPADEVIIFILCTMWIATIFQFYNRRKNSYIQELEEKNQELKLKNGQLKEFTYVVSHDLQEPLRTITSMSSLLRKDEAILNERNQKLLAYVESSSHRMSLLVKGLMTHIHIGTSKELEWVDCGQLIQDILTDLQVTIKENNANVVVTKMPTLLAYPLELRQLFQNLIANGIKYRNPEVNPLVEISSRRGDKYYTFDVKDNGIGIDEAYHEVIFSVFQRLHNQKKYEGTGIGLANCKKIVELHEGEIWVESKEGMGSTFSFTIKNYEKS